MALNLWRIKGKNTQSCGCLNKEFYAPLKKIEGLSAQKSVYAKHKVYCRHRKIESNLSFDEFWNISKLNCEYCGCPPDKELPATDKHGKKIRNGGCTFSGLDRIDNSKQYLLSNILSCCKFCNMAKHTNSIELFLSKVRAIYENLKLGQEEVSDVIESLQDRVKQRQSEADKVHPEDRVVISHERSPYSGYGNRKRKRNYELSNNNNVDDGELL